MRFPPVLLSGLILVLAIGGTAGIFVGCGDSGNESPPPAVTVATTLPLFADMVHEIDRERVEVLTVVPADENPHSFKPSADELERVGDVGLVLYNGLDLEASFEQLLFENKRRGAQIIAFSRDVASPTVDGQTAFEAKDNPHLWLDPLLALTYADTVADSLAIVDGAASSTYMDNLREYKARLRALDEEIAATVDSIPKDKRKLVTFHDSFVHFADRYGFDVIGVVSPAAGEPSSEKLGEIREAIKSQGVAAVFAEAGFDAGPMEQLAADAGVRLCTLYSDVLGAEVKTYVEMMRRNAEELVDCLAGQD